MIRILRPLDQHLPGDIVADEVYRPDQIAAMVRSGVAEVIPDPPPPPTPSKPKRGRPRKAETT